MSNIWCPAAAVRSVRNKSLSLANKGFIILAGCESHLVLLTHDLLSWQVSQLVLLIQDFLSSWQAHSEHKPLTILFFSKKFWPHQMNKRKLWKYLCHANTFFFSFSTPFLSIHSEWRSCHLWNGKLRDIDSHTSYLSFFYTGKIFGEENLHRNLHSKLPIYTVNCQFFALNL